MSNAFTNFLGGIVQGAIGPGPNLKSYQHADRLYVRDTYARAPKAGFLYFVSFNINAAAGGDLRAIQAAGLLVKKIDLPKFTITTETVNQYNRKAVVQTKLTYSPITMEFHDDNSDLTNTLWKNYYNYYYADSKYGDGTAGTFIRKSNATTAFSDTKFDDRSYNYGLANAQTVPFFKSIDIYVLHQHKFTQITLINPLITEWQHDNLNQDEGNKVLHNKMSVAYEDVLYAGGTISKGADSGQFTAVYYDTSPSPLGISGRGNSTLFGAGGIIDGAGSVFGNLQEGNFLAAALQAKTLVSNARNVTKASLQQEGYSILGGALGNIQATGNQPGGIRDAIASSVGALPGAGIAINLFKNSSVDGTTPTKPANTQKK